ncbi:MAG: prolyl oligopeptidase family serine peptidase [Bacteroidota bacterium]
MTRLLALLMLSAPAFAQTDDPFLWLEDVEGEDALAWVEERNATTLEAAQATPEFDAIKARTLAILTSDDRIPYPSILGEHLVNFWTDADNPRGLWRRTTEASYLSGDPEWETLLDIDALGEAEGVNWAYKGTSCLQPDYRHCLVRLSRGGADAVEIREFNTETKQFIEDGFFLPESKGATTWIDENTLLVATDFGEGSMTESGYPRMVKRWTRGTPLEDAELVYTGAESDVGIWAGAYEADGRIIPAIFHRFSFFEGYTLIEHEGEWVELDIPTDADAGFVGDQMTLYLRSDWEAGGTTYPTGTLLAITASSFLNGSRDFEVIVQPGERQTVRGVSTTRNTVLVSMLDEVRPQLWRYRYDGSAWTGERVPSPELATVSVVSTSDTDDRFFFASSGYLQPSTLSLAQDDGGVSEVRQLEPQFDASGLAVEQRHATSADGTRVPYFIVRQEGTGSPEGGTAPTLLYGYGGFEVSLTPSYNALAGANWMARGGVWVVANIRGGGEFGPAWHRSAQRENRQRAYDDFLAVAEHLIETGVTTPDHLGMMGGSNGGLLIGAALTQRPDLFGAAVIQVPLLDMKRYHLLLAGASWMAEYGDPDVDSDWAFISQYSPYQNVDPDAEYPRTLITTTTRDDRVHPGHARKMAALMESYGHEVVYFENTEGGHGSGVTPEQQATMYAVTYGYLWSQLR